jgi:hypothetical protein
MMKKREIDLSPTAVARRHEEMRQLYRLVMYLRGARLIGPAEATARPKADSSR